LFTSTAMTRSLASAPPLPSAELEFAIGANEGNEPSMSSSFADLTTYFVWP
jgi:hypothetical protein